MVDLDDIAAGTGGFKIEGENGKPAGASVSAAGDVNGDGIGDLIVGAGRHGGDGPEVGAAYVVFGRADGFTSPVDLDDVAAGIGGFKIVGENPYDHAGCSVSAAGDVNGDGFDDVIVGSYTNYYDDPFSFAYVVFGSSDGPTSPVDLAEIAAGRGGFRIQGYSQGDFGRGVSDAGDINDDGIDDLLVAETRFGRTYVIFGRAAGFDTSVDLDDIVAGRGGFTIGAGTAMSAAGDINGDGIDDIVIGDPFALNPCDVYDEAGAAHVVFGRADGFTSPIDLHAIATGQGGFLIDGERGTYFAGASVSGAGDVNGDGLDDVVLGSLYRDLDSTGEVYVVFGRKDDFARPVDLGDIAAGRGGFKIVEEHPLDYLGRVVSDAGDVNADGVGDLIVGGGGDAYVIFGSRSGFASPVELGDIAAGRGGFKVQGAGYSVSAAGDVNADGIDDLIVTDGAAAYVIFGRRDPLFTDDDDTRDLADFDLDSFTLAQATRALAGDDVVALSEAQNLGVLFVGNAGDDTITGSSHGDRIRGDAGSDTLFGRGGDDTLWGSEDGDRLGGGAGADHLNGGADADHLRGGNGGDSIIGRGGDDRAFGGRGDDSVRGGEGNDRLLGGAGDDIVSGDAGRDMLTGGAGGDVFRFAFTADSRPGAPDRITDFQAGDRIDLSRLDAVAGGADDAFAFIGGSGFTAPGQLRVFVSGGSTFLQGNTLGNGGTELLVALAGAHMIGEADLVL